MPDDLRIFPATRRDPRDPRRRPGACQVCGGPLETPEEAERRTCRVCSEMEGSA
ncbi:MAG: hypothetical protein ACOCUO_00910 [archaeon]